MTADTAHGFKGYREGCRCRICKAANRDYMRGYRAERRGLGERPPQPDSAAVTVLPTVVVDEPGPIEQGVLDEVQGLSAAGRRPSAVQAAVRLARNLDNPKLAVSHPSTARQLMGIMASLREASNYRQGSRLAAVARLSQRPSSSA